MMLVSGTAVDLLKYLRHYPIFMRLEGDVEDDPARWHRVSCVHDVFDPGIPLLTVSFDNPADELIFNGTDPVKFAIASV